MEFFLWGLGPYHRTADMVDIDRAQLAEVEMFHLSDHEAIRLYRLHFILLTPLVIQNEEHPFS